MDRERFNILMWLEASVWRYRVMSISRSFHRMAGGFMYVSYISHIVTVQKWRTDAGLHVVKKNVSIRSAAWTVPLSTLEWPNTSTAAWKSFGFVSHILHECYKENPQPVISGKLL